MHRQDTRRTGRSLLRSRRGVFELQSITTGVVVSAVLASAVSATVFGAIPWAQDNSAKQNLHALSQAQTSALNSESRYLDTAALVRAEYLDTKTGTVTATDTNGSCYVGLARTSAGKIFYTTSTTTAPALLPATGTVGCLDATQLAALKGALGAPVSTAEAPLATPTFITAPAPVPVKTDVTFSWNPVPGAKYYAVDYQIGTDPWISHDSQLPGTAATITGKAGFTLKVRVQAIADTVASSTATSGTVTIPAVPAAPAITSSTAAGTATFSWAAVPNATGYNIDYRINGGDWVIRTRAQPELNTVVGSKSGDLVEVRVTAVNSSGSSAATNYAVQLP